MKKYSLIILLFVSINTFPQNTFPSSGNVGIGTTNPQKILHVVGDYSWFNRPASKIDNNGANEFGGNVEFNSSYWGSGTASYLRIINPDANTIRFGVDYDGHSGLGGALMNIQFGTATFPYLHIQNNGSTAGNVGIGTTSPGAKLSVIGNAGFADAISVAYNTGNASNFWGAVNIPQGQLSVTVPNGNAATFMGGNVGIGTTLPGGLLDIASGATSYIKITNSAGGRITFNGSVNDYVNAGLFHSSGDVTLGSGGNSNIIFTDGATERMRIGTTGNIGIGTISPSEKLCVNGNIRSKKLIVTQTGWSDYVFNKNYKLSPLSEIEQYIKTNKHLPDIPSAKEAEKDGIDVGDTQALLLKKIEELTLYVIAMEKQNTKQQRQINEQQKEIKQLKKRIH